ncbi:expressed unknown protein [Seminavis robusta]|uniref:Uncharacterized protein n=1 Tax=Seminavis robusta TaxID=568900 RepID=A0A9N8DID6_9STRA|nr:expressed unknown protein [Seminavis robusta]|eukprot:Sro168_g074840.1 n/a (271) ;mRNA; r:52379-53191
MRSAEILFTIASVASWLAAPVFGWDIAAAQNELNTQKAKWESMAIDNYRYQHNAAHDTSGAVYPFTTHVWQGSVVSYVDGQGRQINWLSPNTFGNWFGLIQTYIDQPARDLRVTYDATRGFPATIYIVANTGQVQNFEIFSFHYYQVNYNPQGVQATLDRELAKWTSMNIQNYDYQHIAYHDTTNVVYPFKTEVRNGAGTSLKDGNGQPITWTSPSTMGNWFGLIQNYLNSGAQYIEATYDATRGFPTLIYVIQNNALAYHVEINSFIYF